MIIALYGRQARLGEGAGHPHPEDADGTLHEVPTAHIRLTPALEASIQAHEAAGHLLCHEKALCSRRMKMMAVSLLCERRLRPLHSGIALGKKTMCDLAADRRVSAS